MLTSAFALVEILLLVLGAFAWIQRAGGGPGEALALAIVAALAALSGVFQLAFLVERPALSGIAEAALAGAALWLAVRERRAVGRLFQSARDAFARHPLLLPAAALAGVPLLAGVLLLPPFGRDALSYHLPRVLLFQQESSLFPSEFSKYDLVVKTLGGDILSHAFLRFHSDHAVASLQLLACASWLLASHALSRRVASGETALLATLVIAGLPQLVLQAAVCKSNAFATMTAVACLLLGQRLHERPRAGDLALLLLFLAFGLSVRPNFLAFAAAFAGSFGLLFWLQGSRSEWRSALSGSVRPLLFAALPALILSQVWLFLHNRLRFGGWAGPADFVEFHRNAEGLLGALANAVRYAFQSVHLLPPVDEAGHWLAGWRPSAALKALYAAWFEPLFGGAGQSATHPRFGIRWEMREEVAWFGPFGLALVLPALAFSAWRGRAALRATSVALLGYGLAFCFAVAWFPWNARMLAPVFAGAGPCVAFLLQRLELGRAPRAVLAAAALAVLAYSALHSQPAGAWRESDYGRDRLYVLKRLYGPAVADRVRKDLEPGSKVALIVDQGTPVHPILLGNPRVRFTLVWPWLRQQRDASFRLEVFLREGSFDKVLCLAQAEPLCLAEPPPAARGPGPSPGPGLARGSPGPHIFGGMGGDENGAGDGAANPARGLVELGGIEPPTLRLPA